MGVDVVRGDDGKAQAAGERDLGAQAEAIATEPGAGELDAEAAGQKVAILDPDDTIVSEITGLSAAKLPVPAA